MPEHPPAAGDHADLLRFVARLGHALLGTGDTVAVVEQSMRQIALAHGVEHVNIVALPTVLFVKFESGGRTLTDFTSEEGLALRFDQIEAVFELARDAGRCAVTPAEGLARLQRILASRPALGAGWSLLGHVLMTVGIGLVLQPTPGVIGSAALFGLVVGVLKLLARGRGMLATLLPTVAAFVVALIALQLARYGFPASPFRVLIAALVTFIPGGVLAIATMEFAYGDVVSGASRFMTGLIQLAFLVLGMVAAAFVLGVSPATLMDAGPDTRLGPWAFWFGIALFGVGHVLHQSARPRSLPWVLAVVFIAGAAQAAGTALFGAGLSGVIGAIAITPVAYLVQYRLGGPPAMTTFLPALWLMVPGSLGLIGLASFFDNDPLAGINEIVATLFTIIAIAVGSLIGAGLYNALVEPLFRGTGSVAARIRSWRR